VAAVAEDLTPRLAAAELLRRRRARVSLVEYARSIDIPGAPISEDPDERLFRPVETDVARHHVVILEAIQRTIERPMGRLILLLPPGSGKSTYGDVVAPTWAMGRWPGHRIILASYAAQIAYKQSRKARQVCRSAAFRSIWPDRPALSDEASAVDDWQLTTGSNYMAAGILGGINGNRANGAIGDDLIAGIEEADSPTIRSKTKDAIRNDLKTRLLPNAWIILMNTRWHEDDHLGELLPEDYDGSSGIIACRDGQLWEVLNIPAKAERADDPVGRKIGEYLWPEFYPTAHWQQFENDPLAQRTWSALYQQRPAPDSGTQFKREWLKWYDHEELPERLRLYGATDSAVTENRANDFTEHGIAGMGTDGDLWFVDWWSGQVETDEAIAAFISLISQHLLTQWWDEGGIIEKAIRPAVNRAMREARRYVALESLPSIADKTARVQSFRARASAGTIHLPRAKAWAARLADQLVAFPAGRFDDMVDVCGLLGRGIDRMQEASKPKDAEPQGIKPFTQEWLEWNDEHDKPKLRYR
jgi:predicted phage terminase large subunit-like protein